MLIFTIIFFFFFLIIIFLFSFYANQQLHKLLFPQNTFHANQLSHKSALTHRTFYPHNPAFGLSATCQRAGRMPKAVKSVG